MDYKIGNIQVSIINMNELEEKYSNEKYYGEIKSLMEDVAYCRVEMFPDASVGSLKIIKKADVSKYHYIGFCSQNEKVLLIDNEGLFNEFAEELEIKYEGKVIPVAHLFHDLLLGILSKDGLFLQSYWDRLELIEESIMDENKKIDGNDITIIRKELLTLNAYYNQINDMIDIICDNDVDFLSEQELHLFNMLDRRVDRLTDQLSTLRDYSLQVRDMYQNDIDAHQNDVMTLLTIFTSIFFPLSIITGWYGMNFKFMPELNHPYAYLIIILISAAIVLVEIWFLKKKNYLKKR